MQTELTNDQLAAFNAQLNSLKQELQNAISMAEEASKPIELDQSLQGRVSRGDARQQQEMVKAALQRNQQRLKKVVIALNKFDQDEYGYCENCDELISINRLEIMPESPLCISCQEDAD